MKVAFIVEVDEKETAYSIQKLLDMGNQIPLARKYALILATFGAYNIFEKLKMSNEEFEKMDTIINN